MRRPHDIFPVYPDSSSGPLLGQLHAASNGNRRDAAVLMVAPFGWDEVASYRCRRDWAVHLTESGYPTLRFDLPGTGDSAGSPRDPGRVPAWLDAVSATADWLRAETGARRMVGLGLGMGGVLACAAMARGAAIDDLALWAVPSRGRTLLRELRVFASLEEPDQGASVEALVPLPSESAAEPPSEEGHMQVGGFVLTPETIEALTAIDLATDPMPPARRRRVLMLERDGSPVDARLREHLESSDCEVEVAPGPGYGEMTGDPNLAEPPLAVFGAVKAWLDAASDPVDGPPPARASERPGAVELGSGGREIREEPIMVEQSFGALFGVLSEPVAPPVAPVCVVLLNAGSIRHAGPDRMWVEAARRWASQGVATLRLDLEGLGDADGDRESASLAALYDPRRIGQIGAALDELQARGLGPRFVLGGLCSGAFWSFHAALEDERVTAALLLNPMTLFWDPAVDRVRELRRAFRDPAMWRRVLRGQVRSDRMLVFARWLPRAPVTGARRLVSRWRGRRAGGDPLDQALARLQELGTNVLVAFSGHEPLHDELTRAGRLDAIGARPHVVVDSLPGRTHVLRSMAAQRATHAALDRALAAELERAGAGVRAHSPVGGA